jgi:transcriptional regulator with XRE-family HTH domain
MTHAYGTNPNRMRVRVGATTHPNGSDKPAANLRPVEGENRGPAHVGAPSELNATDEAGIAQFDRSKGKPRTRALVPLDHPQPDTRGMVPEDEALFLAEGFGAYLKAMRKEVGLTQAQASKLCGLTVSTISKLERGNRRPGVPAVKALSRVLAPAGEVEAMEQRLAGLAGDSLREGADRKKLQTENRRRRQALADMEKNVAKARSLIRRQEANGQAVNATLRRFLEHGERLAEKLRATPEQKPETIPGFQPERVPVPRTSEKFSGRPAFANFASFLAEDEDDE